MNRFKNILEYTESIVTILGFLFAIWGSLTVLESETIAKLTELINYHHGELNDKQT